MADINFNGLSLCEAEEAVAEIWSCLEEYDIPSPVVNVGACTNARITMGFTFEEPIWAELVTHRLSTLMCGVGAGWRSSALPTRKSDAARPPSPREETTICFLHVAAALPAEAVAGIEVFRRAKRR